MDSAAPSASFRLSNLYSNDPNLQIDLKKQSLSSMKMQSSSPFHSRSNSPVNKENTSPQSSPPTMKTALSPKSNILQNMLLANHTASPTTSPQHVTKKHIQSPAPAGCFQLELEKQSSLFQLSYAEDRYNQLMQKTMALEASLRNAEGHSDKIERELSVAKQEIVTLQFEKDNLSNEVRKLSREVSAPRESSAGMSVWGQMTAASRELSRVEDELASSQRDLNELREENESLSRQVEKFAVKEDAYSVTVQELILQKKKNEELAETLATMMQEKSNMSKQLEAQEFRFQKEIHSKEEYCQKLQQELVSKERDVELLFSEKEYLQGKLEEIKSYGSRDSDISSLTAATLVSEDNSSKRKRNSEADAEYGETLEMLEEYKNKLYASENKRRKLLNELQDLRGNIRVFVRCRPFLPGDYGDKGVESEEELMKCINCNVEGTTVSVATSDANLRGAGQVFQFDKVFDDSVKQATVFAEVSDLVQSSLDGFRVCIFSYGQTGSGKTHTMTGSHQGEDRGLISRSVEQIIDRINFMKSSGWTVRATYSMLEVYNETLIDLLAADSTKGTMSSANIKLQISMQNDRVVVKNLTEEVMRSDSVEEGLSQLEDILQRANSMRATASTAMNAVSSRSHALFFMNIDAKHVDGTCVQGGLRLVDLAGSERLARTGTQSDAARLRETVNINKSLSCLGDVFLGLSKKSAHIPYRNSKLTMLLQDCLGGNGKTLMFVNISPTIESGQETVCSLKFANQVNQVQLGAAKKSVTIVQQQLPPPAPVSVYPPPASLQQSSWASESSTLSLQPSPARHGTGTGSLRSQTASAVVAAATAHSYPHSNSQQASASTLPIQSPIKRRPMTSNQTTGAQRNHNHHNHHHMHSSSRQGITTTSPAHKAAPRRERVGGAGPASSSSVLARSKPKKAVGGWR